MSMARSLFTARSSSTTLRAIASRLSGKGDRDAVPEPRSRVAEEVLDDAAHASADERIRSSARACQPERPALLVQERGGHVDRAERVAQVVPHHAEDEVHRLAPALQVRLRAPERLSRVLVRSTEPVAIEGAGGAIGGGAEEQERVLVERLVLAGAGEERARRGALDERRARGVPGSGWERRAGVRSDP